jgi:tetratricopeptide (TPR) repeat protein
MTRSGADAATLPESVEGLLTIEIDNLAPQPRRLLRYAAVLGRTFERDLFGEIIGEQVDDPDTLDALARHLELEDGGRIRFRHALVRDAAYEALPFRVRRRLHAQAAELTLAAAADDPDDVAPLLAQHYHAAHRWPDSWRWSRRAGERSAEQGAPVEAVHFLSAALEASRRLEVADDDVAAVAETLGDAAILAGAYDTAAVAFRTARRSVDGDVLRRADLERKEGRLRERAGNYAQAKRWYQRAQAALDGDEREAAVALRARVVACRGAAELRQGRVRAALPLLEDAVEGARAAGDRAGLAHAYLLLDWALTDAGTPDPTYRSLALPIYEELGDHVGQGEVLNNLGGDAYYEGRWDDAVALYERSRVAFERGGDIVQVATVLSNIGEIRGDQGRYDEAETLLHEALDIVRAVSFRVGAGWATGNLGRVAARRGEFDRAQALLAEARDEMRAIGAEALGLEVEAREAERRLYAGDHAGALALAEDVLGRVDRQGGGQPLLSTLHRIAGAALLAAGKPEAGRQRLDEAVRAARAVDAPFEEALALDAAGDREAAGAIFARLGVVVVPGAAAQAPGPLTGTMLTSST